MRRLQSQKEPRRGRRSSGGDAVPSAEWRKRRAQNQCAPAFRRSGRNLRPPCPLTYAGLFIVLLFTPTGPATCSMTSALRGASFLGSVSVIVTQQPSERSPHLPDPDPLTLVRQRWRTSPA